MTPIIPIITAEINPPLQPWRKRRREGSAGGRMLFLSLYPADTHKPDKKTLYTRCHEMVDLANASTSSYPDRSPKQCKLYQKTAEKSAAVLWKINERESISSNATTS